MVCAPVGRGRPILASAVPRPKCELQDFSRPLNRQASSEDGDANQQLRTAARDRLSRERQTAAKRQSRSHAIVSHKTGPRHASTRQ